ncbi:MAG TPA: ABC transporter ATP-binding protein [Candidatus Limnocylindria bacterium]|nr:ABC transporter ATP-binding protein [Candidatus Limnocylindria bacterium]
MLSLHDLSAGYGQTQILRSVSLTVEPGEIVAVIGRNGMGKSTLMKAIMGLVRCMGGTIHFNGADITSLQTHLRARGGIGYIPQGRGIFPDLSVAENLAVGELINARAGAKSPDVAYEYFPRLKERRRQRAGTLSGGEQSMLAIGRVLVGKPDLLVLDEPSEGVQPNIVAQIGEILHQINRDLGLTVLFVEQNINLIRRVAQRCYVIDKGDVVARVAREQLDDDALHKYLAI